jgi:iron complex outermembrane receptor protein
MQDIMRQFSGRIIIPAVLALVAGSPVYAQSPAAISSDEDELIELSPFTVTTTNASRYQVADATSSSRVRVSLFDAQQSVSVLTREFVEDVGAGRTLDVAKYISGITESTVPNGLDRVMIRGFQSDGHIVDGFRSTSQANFDPAVVDRIEVVKGPNAIIAPTGIPGGTINLVSKKAEFRDFGSATVQVGQYDANRAEIDVNRKVNAHTAVRFVGAVQDSDAYYNDSYQRSWVVSPSVTWQFGHSSTLSLRFHAHRWRSNAYIGIPLDPSVGPNDRARLLAGMPKDFNPYNGDVRGDEKQELSLFYTGQITDRLAVRVAGRYGKNDYITLSHSIGGAAGGGINPLTGLWTPGFTYGPAPTFTPIPAATSRIYSRGGSFARIPQTFANLQSDFVYTFETDKWKSTTLFGLAATRYEESDFEIINSSKPTFDIDAFTPADPVYAATYNTHSRNVVADEQVYLQQTVEVFDGRVIANGGISRNWFHGENNNLLTNVVRTVGPDKFLPSAGLVVKPLPNVALYYSFAKSASAPGATNPRENIQLGTQNEIGVRTKFLGGRAMASIAYWDIKQDNVSIPNALNLAVPPPVPSLPPVITNRIADGWEFEVNAAVTKQLSVIANYTKFTSRDPRGVPFRGVAEESGAIWTHYSFNAGALRGFSAGIGVAYTGRRPGEQASANPTAASTPTNIIVPQPSFWIPSSTLVELSASYEVNDQWKLRLKVDNLLDEDYIAAGLSRFLVYPGTPRNVKVAATYSF